MNLKPGPEPGDLEPHARREAKERERERKREYSLKMPGGFDQPSCPRERERERELSSASPRTEVFWIEGERFVVVVCSKSSGRSC